MQMFVTRSTPIPASVYQKCVYNVQPAVCCAQERRSGTSASACGTTSRRRTWPTSRGLFTTGSPTSRHVEPFFSREPRDTKQLTRMHVHVRVRTVDVSFIQTGGAQADYSMCRLYGDHVLTGNHKSSRYKHQLETTRHTFNTEFIRMRRTRQLDLENSSLSSSFIKIHILYIFYIFILIFKCIKWNMKAFIKEPSTASHFQEFKQSNGLSVLINS